ncbi:arylsulfatase [uncultured Kriegella sp.]|uniref:arylsulfatase n=1 Tax=uncultured Kriegella sp. TaxID=1798910 RepID=UPI0030DA1D0D|tara:strand:+ start:12152 stop:13876 length:1725 start_codon:yes stop_codon:yes gene_type:complete
MTNFAFGTQAIYVRLILMFFLLFFTSCLSKHQENITRKYSKPNIIIVMLDDLGFSDISCYGSEIPTPNIDALANNGLKYTQFRNAARCCPTRASLMTGLYPHQAGIGHMMNDLGYEGYKGDLSIKSVTIAQVLKSAGYITYMAGKWHLTRFTKPLDSTHNWPIQRGFDKFYGTLPGYGSQYNPVGLMENNNFISPPKEFYYTDALTQKSVSYINEASETQKPFFLYLAYTAPHYPLHATKKAIDRHRGRFSKGWDSLRSTRFGRLKNLGMLRPETKLPERDGMSISWEDEPNQGWQESRMEAYAGMIEHIDQGIGNIMRALEVNEQLDNTIIFFLSDNGGSAEGHINNTVERWGTPWKSPLIPEKTKNGEIVTSGDFVGLELGPEHTFGSYGPKWSNLSNAPFRMHKNWVHEGGISTPFIVHWPNGIEDKGTMRHQRGHVMDIMATCLEISGATYPTENNGHSIKALQGISLVPSFRNNGLDRKEPLFWEHEGNRAVIRDRWKLVSAYPGSWSSMMEFENHGNWELYDLEIDRTETNNLAAQFPEIVEELSKDWKHWADNNGVVNYRDLNLETY